jgi:hypothetical protein
MMTGACQRLKKRYPLLEEKKENTGLTSISVLTQNRDTSIPLTGANRGDIGLSISGRPDCSGPPAHLPEALAGYAVQNALLHLIKINT